jgi:hypothetical protein
MNNEVFELSDKDKWNLSLKSFDKLSQDIYFTPEYYSLYEDNGDGNAKCFFYESEYGKVLYPFVINSINKLGYELDEEYFDIQGVYGYNGCVYSNLSKELIDDFYSEFNKYCIKKNIVAEFSRFHPILKNHLFSKNHMNISLDRKTVLLNLDQPYEKIFKLEYNSSNRNKIRIGKKLLYSEISNDINSLDIFKDNYLKTMKRLNSEKYYFFSKKYFHGFNDQLKKNTYIINIFDIDKKKVQNSMILLINGKFAHYHLSGRSDDCKISAANNFMLDEAIRFSLKKGCIFFHLGGGTTAIEKDPLFQFKLNFSQNKLEFYTGFKVYIKKTYEKVCKVWIDKNPDKKLKYKNYNLKYRVVN